MRSASTPLALALLLAAPFSSSCATGPGPGAEASARQPGDPPAPAGCVLELQAEVEPAAPSWGDRATVGLRVVNFSSAPQDVVVRRNCPTPDLRVEVGGVLFDPTESCMAGQCLELPPPQTFTLAPGESRVVGTLEGALGPKEGCMDAELPRGPQELRVTARIESGQQTCELPRTIELK